MVVGAKLGTDLKGTKAMSEPQMTKIEEAEKTLATLEDRRTALVQKAADLADERQRISFAAHAGGDAKARKRLDEINGVMASHSSEVESVQAAIDEASRRLDAAHRDAALEADRVAAHQLNKELETFEQTAKSLDVHLEKVVIYATILEQTLIAMNSLGAPAPSRAQLDALGTRALLTALQKTPFSRAFSPIPPNERRTFGALIKDWSVLVRNNIAARLGDEKHEAA